MFNFEFTESVLGIRLRGYHSVTICVAWNLNILWANYYSSTLSVQLLPFSKPQLPAKIRAGDLSTSPQPDRVSARWMFRTGLAVPDLNNLGWTSSLGCNFCNFLEIPLGSSSRPSSLPQASRCFWSAIYVQKALGESFRRRNCHLGDDFDNQKYLYGHTALEEDEANSETQEGTVVIHCLMCTCQPALVARLAPEDTTKPTASTARSTPATPQKVCQQWVLGQE
ncbi:hypothetical protein B0H11DRAFT_2205708 [Mycena galericulata]|nr:hypothetical protein B0H11DRAFT_2205708 [Mycena galericulata]